MSQRSAFVDEVEIAGLERGRGDIAIIPWEIRDGTLQRRPRPESPNLPQLRQLNVLYSGSGHTGHFDALLPVGRSSRRRPPAP